MSYWLQKQEFLAAYKANLNQLACQLAMDS